MPTDPRAAPETPRRRFLQALVLVPAAAAAATGCAGAGGGKAAAAPAPPATAAPGATEALGWLRAAPVAPQSEPAFVFRALTDEG